jgi:hypothetical protein
MLRSLSLAALSALSLAVACSSTPPAEQPTSTAAPDEGPPPEPEEDPNAGSTAEVTTKTQMGSVKTDGKKDDTIPDDYTIVEGDCIALGHRLASVVRSDHMAQLSPKLPEDKRAKAEENIHDVAEKLSTQWVNGCRSNLVGKVADRAQLKCALESRTMKAFEECINPPVEKK